MRTVVALFDSSAEARSAIEELAEIGFAPENVGMVTNADAQSALEMGARLRSMSLIDVGRVAIGGQLLEAVEESSRPQELSAILQSLGLDSDAAQHYAHGVELGQTLESATIDDTDADRVVAVMKKHAARTGRESKTRDRE